MDFLFKFKSQKLKNVFSAKDDDSSLLIDSQRAEFHICKLIKL